MTKNADVSRREFVKRAGTVTAVAATVGAPAIQTIRAANDQVQYGMVGTGSRGNYLLKHLKKIPTGRCVALCDIQDDKIKAALGTVGGNPTVYRDYAELLARKDIDAVYVVTPLFRHFPVTRDALLAGKHVFCEKCLVFKPEEVHALRALSAEHPTQIMQTGLQRRYSRFYQMVKGMVDKGLLGNVHHIHAQWHRNMINKPVTSWTMKPGAESNINNWRLFRSMSGGIPAELASHQVDVADWMFGATPEFVMGLGSIDTFKDGRNVYDNVQLIYKYPKGQKLTYSSISTNQFCPYFNGTRAEMAEVIMGTEGTVEITVGFDESPCIAWWYPEPPKATTVGKAAEKSAAAVAGATMIAAGGNVRPIPLMTDDLTFSATESFFARELKFARRMLTAKGILVQEEGKNPVDTELESFFQNCRDGKAPLAHLEIGMNDSIAVMLSNLCMDEDRKVRFDEIAKMGLAPKGEPARSTSRSKVPAAQA